MLLKYFGDLDTNNFYDKLILLDVDGTLVFDGQCKLNDSSLGTLESLKKNNNILYYCSNKNKCADRNSELVKMTGITHLDVLYKKPNRKILDFVSNPDQLPLVVIGDKFITDGLFAKNIGAEFLKVKRLTTNADSLGVKLTYLIDDVIYFLVIALKLIRPQQWVKNLLVFAPVFFAGEILNVSKLTASFFVFLSFSAAASSVYIINDIADIAQDALHPRKRFRPLAAGQISKSAAMVLCMFLFVISLALTHFFNIFAIWVILGYYLTNLAYSFFLKKVVILDILLVSFFYLLRILAGGLGSDTFISHWIVLCVILISLFMVVGKRRAEFFCVNKRSVLQYYNEKILDSLLVISAGLSITAYGIYSVLGFNSSWLVYSILFVVMGIFRYLFIVFTSGDTEYPEKLIFKDKVILSSIAGWLLYMFIIFYNV